VRMLITGGAGFIGSEFVRQAVRKGHQVAVVDKLTYAGDLERLSEVTKDITFYKADISNQEFIEHIFEKENPEVVVHFCSREPCRQEPAGSISIYRQQRTRYTGAVGSEQGKRRRAVCEHVHR